MSVLVIYGSSRENGNSEQLMKHVLADIEHTEIHLKNFTVLPITDERHTESGFQTVIDDYDYIMEAFLEHDIVLFATPLYWYGMSGALKDFFDRWSQSLRDTRYQFKQTTKVKKGFIVIVGGDHPRIKALPLVQQFQYIFDFVSMSFEDYIIGKGSKPGEVLEDERALFDALWLNKKLKNMIT